MPFNSKELLGNRTPGAPNRMGEREGCWKGRALGVARLGL